MENHESVETDNVSEIPETSTAIALPRTVDDLINQRKSKKKQTLNDQVESHHLSLYEQPEYQRFLDAVWMANAIEGSLFVDDIMACEMIRHHARETGNRYVATQPLAAIRRSLLVVLRRYNISRKERREA